MFLEMTFCTVIWDHFIQQIFTKCTSNYYWAQGKKKAKHQSQEIITKTSRKLGYKEKYWLSEGVQEKNEHKRPVNKYLLSKWNQTQAINWAFKACHHTVSKYTETLYLEQVLLILVFFYSKKKLYNPMIKEFSR